MWKTDNFLNCPAKEGVGLCDNCLQTLQADHWHEQGRGTMPRLWGLPLSCHRRLGFLLSRVWRAPIVRPRCRRHRAASIREVKDA